MHRIFFSNLLFSLLLNLLVKPIAIFGIDAQVQNVVGLDNYGWYFSLLSLSLILNILMDLGINNYVIKTVAKNQEEAKSQISSILLLRIVLFLFYLGMLFSIAFLLGYDSIAMKMLFFLGLNQLFIVFIAYFRGFFSGLQHYKLDSFFSIFDRIILIITATQTLNIFIFFNDTEKLCFNFFRCFKTIDFISYGQDVNFIRFINFNLNFG